MTDIQIKQGTDSGYAWPLFQDNGLPFVLTGYKVRSQIRTLDGKLLHSFTTELGNAVISGNTVYITWTSAETSLWKWTTGKYDLEIVSATNKVARIDGGAVNISKEITR